MRHFIPLFVCLSSLAVHQTNPPDRRSVSRHQGNIYQSQNEMNTPSQEYFTQVTSFTYHSGRQVESVVRQWHRVVRELEGAAFSHVLRTRSVTRLSLLPDKHKTDKPKKCHRTSWCGRPALQEATADSCVTCQTLFA